MRIAKTIRKSTEGILEYIRTGFNNGRAEGINNKVRAVTKRAFGFHHAASLIGMILLCCGGLHLEPSHVPPYGTHENSGDVLARGPQVDRSPCRASRVDVLARTVSAPCTVHAREPGAAHSHGGGHLGDGVVLAAA